MLGTPWGDVGTAPDGLDSPTCCPMPGSLLGLRVFAPCGPYVPFCCHVADAYLGTKDESFEQGEERRVFGWGWVIVDEIGG